MQAAPFAIPHGHPSLPGHFPGRPIVPGVVLLEEVMARLPTGLTLLAAKFVSPVLPGELVAVSSTQRPDGRVGFSAAVGDRQVLHGTVGPPP